MNTNGKAFIGGKVNVDGKFYEEDKVAVEKPVVNVQELSVEELIETLIETLRFLQMEPKIVDNETYVIPEDKITTPPPHINTGGGKYVKGNINTGGKDFVGRKPS